MKKLVLVLWLIALLISACASEDTGRALVGTWRLTGYGPADSPTPAVPDTEATITFGQDGSVGGSTGCNEFGGTYTVEGDQITFGELVSTLVLCPDPQMAQEEAMYQVLIETASFQIAGNTLTITKDGMVLVFEAVDRAA